MHVLPAKLGDQLAMALPAFVGLEGPLWAHISQPVQLIRSRFNPLNTFAYYEECRLLGRKAVRLLVGLTFCRKVSPPSSRCKESAS
jgi:hypothetical protein